jgi:hypothetical protein
MKEKHQVNEDLLIALLRLLGLLRFFQAKSCAEAKLVNTICVILALIQVTLCLL